MCRTVGLFLPEPFGTIAGEMLFACRALGCGLVLGLHSLGGLSGGELAQLGGLGSRIGGTGTPLLRIPHCTAFATLGGDELRGRVVAEHLEGKPARFEWLPFVGEA